MSESIWKPRLALGLLFILASLGLRPEAIASDQLAPWKDWLLDRHPEHQCARHGDKLQQRICAWPGPLRIEVSARGGLFEQLWRTEGETWIELPGSPRHWPLQVSLNGEPALVLERQQKPVLRVGAGEHSVRGRFDWGALPQRLMVPKATARLRLTINGQAVVEPALDDSGALWLQTGRAQQANGESDSARLEVFRSLDDAVPRSLTTIVRLSISGKARELQTGRLLLPDMQTESFSSPLPAKIEPDGRLRIQVRSGEWQIVHRARVSGDVNEFRTIATDQSWPIQELWGYVSQPSIRRAKLAGVTLIDGSQLDLPKQLANQPLFLMTANSVLNLQQQYRGDEQPQANQLSLQRRMWLDFDGQGAIVSDLIEGRMFRDWRLEVQPELALGSVEVNGEARVVTQASADSGAGVEIRDPNVSLLAVSRLAMTDVFSASGWLSNFDSVSARLEIPPGWQVWHVAGPDQVSRSWISQWDLWDIFLSLIVIIGVYRLMGWRWMLLTLLVGLLTYHERGSVFVYLVVFIILLPLLRTVPSGKLHRSLVFVAAGSMLLVLLGLLDFSVKQLRTAMYPQLEYQRVIHDSTVSVALSKSQVPAADAAAELEEVIVTGQARNPYSQRSRAASQGYETRRIDPSVNAQTGPGVPAWRWRQVRLSWNGPVSSEEPVRLYLTGPQLTRVLKLIQVAVSVALVCAIALALFRAARRTDEPNSEPNTGAAATASVVASMVLLPALLLAPAAKTQDFPPKYLLDEYEQRLIKQPQCTPNCATIAAVDIEVVDDVLSIRQIINVATQLAVAMPSSKQWQAQRITVNGESRPFLRRLGDTAYLSLIPGRYEVILSGRLHRSQVSLEFVGRVHNVSASGEGWAFSGLVNKSLRGNTLALERIEKTTVNNTLLPDPPPPFAVVTRQFEFGLDWFVTTTVSRVAPAQGPIHFAVPLLAGESVLTNNVLVKDTAVSVSLGARQTRYQWRSELQPSDQMVLQHPRDVMWSERWMLDVTPRWHVDFEGLAPLKAAVDEGAQYEWRPWPGEQLTLRLAQPQAVSGPTTTVESVVVNVKPGKRILLSDAQLLVRSSTGGDFNLRLPEESRLKSLTLNDEALSAQHDGRLVVAALRPGDNQLSLSWEQDQRLALSSYTPSLELDQAASNVRIHLTVPRDRWPIFAYGPGHGPAMLYWSVLLVIIMLAYALGTVKSRANLSMPINTWQWVLLGLGISTVSTVGSLFVVAWFFALEARQRYTMPSTRGLFNLIQLGLIALSVIAAVSLLSTIPVSLLSSPDMKVSGNGSSNYFMQWYVDQSGPELPSASLVSVSLWVYRLVMLAWSLWLVFSLLRWASWAWQALSKDQLWMPKDKATAASSG